MKNWHHHHRRLFRALTVGTVAGLAGTVVRRKRERILESSVANSAVVYTRTAAFIADGIAEWTKNLVHKKSAEELIVEPYNPPHLVYEDAPA
jgi:hypothetical protein